MGTLRNSSALLYGLAAIVSASPTSAATLGQKVFSCSIDHAYGTGPTNFAPIDMGQKSFVLTWVPPEIDGTAPYRHYSAADVVAPLKFTPIATYDRVQPDFFGGAAYRLEMSAPDPLGNGRPDEFDNLGCGDMLVGSTIQTSCPATLADALARIGVPGIYVAPPLQSITLEAEEDGNFRYLMTADATTKSGLDELVGGKPVPFNVPGGEGPLP